MKQPAPHQPRTLRGRRLHGGREMPAVESLMSGAAFLLAASAASTFFQLRSANVSDPDGFYHIQHAALYRANGLTMTDFPWIPWSVIHSFSSDIWYGFHLLLVPFTLISDPGLRVKAPGIFLTCAMLGCCGWALARLRVAAAAFWPFVLLLAGPNVLYHLTMTRPHVLTTGLAVLLFSFLVEGGAAAVFFTCLAITFVHVSFCWLI